MSKEERRDKIKDWLTIVILIMYITSQITAALCPSLSQRLLLKIDELEQIEKILE